MHTVWKKLQVKDQTRFLVLAAPPEFYPVLEDRAAHWTIDNYSEITTSVASSYEAVIAFVTDEEQVKQFAELLQADSAGNAVLVWLCYPKKTSKKYKVSIDRDHGWNPLIELEWYGVRQISIDEDWSALRFRPRSAIKNLSRKKPIP